MQAATLLFFAVATFLLGSIADTLRAPLVAAGAFGAPTTDVQLSIDTLALWVGSSVFLVAAIIAAVRQLSTPRELTRGPGPVAESSRPGRDD